MIRWFILAWSGTEFLSTFTSTSHGIHRSIIANPCILIIDAWPRHILNFFGYNISTLTVTHLVGNSSVLGNWCVRVIVAGTWVVTSAYISWSTSYGNCLCIIPKSFRRIILTWSRLVQHFLGDYICSLTFCHFMWYDSIFSEVLICLITAWSWYIWLNCIIRFSSN